jgi:hypothetical protein
MRRIFISIATGLAILSASAACTGEGEPNQTHGQGVQGQSSTTRSPRAASAQMPVHDKWTSCSAEPSVAGGKPAVREALTLPLLDPHFTPVKAITCRLDAVKAADSENKAPMVESVSIDISSLLQALARQDEPEAVADADSELEICEDAIFDVPWLALLDNEGHWIRPGLPQDSCGHVQAEVRTAINSLPIETSITTQPSPGR